MKNLTFTLLLVSLVLFAFGQECAVKISYSINKTNPPGYSFTTDYSGGEAKYYWNFGDNTMSDSPTPIHSYKITGTYEVNLKIVDVNNKVCYGKINEKFEGETAVTDHVILTGRGKVKASGVEGCGLLIYLENGSVIKPLKIDTDFALRDGLYVELAYEYITEQTNCNLGKPVVIHRISEMQIYTQCKAYFVSEMVPPTGDFASKTVVFSNKSTGEIQEIKWSFGDGTYSTDLNPTHEYKEFGEYKVCMIISTKAGCKSDYCGTVRVVNTNAATCAFDLTVQRKPETTNTFIFNTISKAEITTWKWSFGDGTYGEKKEVVHTYEKPGIYEVVCVITSANCTSRKMVKVEVNLETLPTCSGAINLMLIEPTLNMCNGKATVKLLDENGNEYSNVNYFWSNGKTGETVESLCYDKPYLVRSVIEKTCQKNTSFTFISKPSWKAFTSGINSIFEVMDPKAGLSYKWDFGDGCEAYGASAKHVYPDDGVYNVKLTVIGDGSSEEFIREVSVLKSATPVIDVAGNDFDFYPNPATSQLQIVFGELQSGNYIFEILDLKGTQVLINEIVITKQNIVSLNIDNLRSGIYFLNIKSDNLRFGGKKFIKKE